MSLIILASASAARQQMLKNAGVDFHVMPSDIDEESIIEDLKDKSTAEEIALCLAKEKSLKNSSSHKEHYIIGSDQVLSIDNIIYSKAENEEEAKERLSVLQGKTHILSSAICVSKNGETLWEYTENAYMTMHAMDSQDIEIYSKNVGEALTLCVGAYAIEQTGIQLFKKIEGDYFTILGMPLLPLLNYLREVRALS